MKKLIQQKQDSYNCYQSSYLPVVEDEKVIEEIPQSIESSVEEVPDCWDDQLDAEDDGVEVILNMDQESKKVSKKTKKTIPCRFGESCKRDVCNFAHSIAELDIIKCKRGNQCLNDSCIFYHPCDTIEQHFDRLKPTLSQKDNTTPTPVKSIQDKTKTAMCSFGKDCKRDVCNFAHTVDELRVFECTFKSSCRNGNKCAYFHPEKETKEEFVERKFGIAPQPKAVAPQPNAVAPLASYPPLPAPWARTPKIVSPPQDEQMIQNAVKAALLSQGFEVPAPIVIQCSKENFMDVLKQVQGQSNVRIQIV